MEWTSKMSQNRYSPIYTKSGHLINDRFYHEQDNNQEKTVSDDTKNRYKILKEMEERNKIGEDISKIAKEIASRPEIQEQFSYFVKNGIKTPLSEIFINWFNSKQNSKERRDKINGIEH